MDTVKPLCFIRANLKCPKSMKFHLPPSLNCEEKVKPRLVSMKSKHPLLVFVIGLSGLRPLSSRALNVYVYIFLNGFSLFLFVFEGIWFLLSRCFPNTGDFVYFVLKRNCNKRYSLHNKMSTFHCNEPVKKSYWRNLGAHFGHSLSYRSLNGWGKMNEECPYKKKIQKQFISQNFGDDSSGAGSLSSNSFISALSSQEDIALVDLHMQLNKPITESPLLMSSYINHMTQVRFQPFHPSLA